MARVLLRTIEPPRRCSYLATERASLEYRLLLDVGPEEHEELLSRGWRRFGLAYFRPACAPCTSCFSVRVPVATFTPSRSQRRAAKKAAALRCEVGPVRVDDARLALHAAWHASREGARGWEALPLTENDYARDFAMPHPCAREHAYWDDDAPGGPRLVAIGLCDETPHAQSAIYTFYDPAYASLSPGIAHVLRLIERARAQGKPHVYLGYWVPGCPSMEYKATFRPHEILEGRPALDTAPVWRPAQGAGEDAPRVHTRAR